MVNEVKKEVKKAEKDNFYLTLLKLLKQGKNPAKISKELTISKQKLNYYISLFKKKGLIQKKGYGLWEVKKLPLRIHNLTSKEIRGHAFIWIIKVPQEIGGSLKEKASKLGTIMNKGQVRLIIKGHKVWIGNKSIVVYENKDFYGKNSIESRKYAVINLLEVLRALQQELGVSIKRYVFKISKEHYSQIKNDLAKQYNRNKEKMVIHDDLEGDWLWIDDSDGLNELEVSGTKAIVRSKQVQDWWNDNKKHDFKVNASFILDTLAKSQIQLQEYAKQNVEHLKLIKQYRKENKAWRKNESIKIKKEVESQRSITEWS